jgi:hypothetical protein
MALGRGLRSDTIKKPCVKSLSQWIKTMATISPEEMVRAFKECYI